MNAPALISFGVTVVVAGILLLLVLETIRLAKGEPPITYYARRLVVKLPGWAMAVFSVVSFLLGLLIAHFAWT